MSAHISNVRTEFDQEIIDIVDYVRNYQIDSTLALDTARNCLIDTLGCGLEALEYPACKKLMGPIKYWYMRKIIRRMSGKQLVAVSDGIAQELKTASLYNASSVTTIYNPFDIARIKSLSNEITTQLPLEKYILHAGRAAKAK